MTTRTLAVVTAGLSQPSSSRLLADRLAASAAGSLADAGVEPSVAVIELRDHAHDLMDHVLTGFPTPDLREVIDTVVRADGLIVVTPIFNASYSGLFKSFFDVVDPDALRGRPLIIGATGGTARHSLALEHAVRPMFAHLHAIVVPTVVFAAAEDWGAAGAGDSLGARIDRAAGELAMLVGALPHDGPADPYDDVTPFEQMLTGEPGSPPRRLAVTASSA